MKRRNFIGLFLGGLGALFGLKKAPAKPVYVRTGLELKYPHLPILDEEKQCWWKPLEEFEGHEFEGIKNTEWRREMIVGAPSEALEDPFTAPSFLTPIDWRAL